MEWIVLAYAVIAFLASAFLWAACRASARSHIELRHAAAPGSPLVPARELVLSHD